MLCMRQKNTKENPAEEKSCKNCNVKQGGVMSIFKGCKSKKMNKFEEYLKFD